MASNYNSTVWFYDFLAKIIYGDSIKHAQTAFLHLIPANSTVLIAGGGTGWILEEIVKVYPAGLTIYYVEISDKMIALSSKRHTADNKVLFINKAVEDFTGHDITAVITPFLFDNHNSNDAKDIFMHIDRMIKPGAIWLDTDFQLSGKRWQLIMLKSMLLFFRIFGAVRNRSTTDMQPVFFNAGYKNITEKSFYGDFIRTNVWQKLN